MFFKTTLMKVGTFAVQKSLKR